MMTPKQVVIEWMTAFNRRDAAAAALCHDDATKIQVPLDEPVRGHQAMMDSSIAILRAFPDGYTQVEQIFGDGEWATMEWSLGGTFHGEFAGNTPTDRTDLQPGRGAP